MIFDVFDCILEMLLNTALDVIEARTAEGRREAVLLAGPERSLQAVGHIPPTIPEMHPVAFFAWHSACLPCYWGCNRTFPDTRGTL